MASPNRVPAGEDPADAITAFTDLRRLQILRRLLTKGEATVQQLRNELGLSAAAPRRWRAGWSIEGSPVRGRYGPPTDDRALV